MQEEGRRRQEALKANSCQHPWRAKHAGRVGGRAPPKEVSLQQVCTHIYVYTYIYIYTAHSAKALLPQDRL